MKQIIFLLFFVRCSFMNGQIVSNTEKADSSNIYFESLSSYILENNILNDMYIEKSNITTVGLPEKINKVKIHLLDENQLRIMAKMNNRNKITRLVYRVIPLRIKDGVFFVTIIPFEIMYKKKMIQMANMGGVSIKFNYDCEKDVFMRIDEKTSN